MPAFAAAKGYRDGMEVMLGLFSQERYLYERYPMHLRISPDLLGYKRQRSEHD
jgi:hypothetical protein